MIMPRVTKPLDQTGAEAERIAKRIARAGLCSRRDAERWIAAGRVAVDGTVLTSPAVTVTAANRVTIDGEALPQAEAARLYRYHKRAGAADHRPRSQGPQDHLSTGCRPTCRG